MSGTASNPAGIRTTRTVR